MWNVFHINIKYVSNNVNLELFLNKHDPTFACLSQHRQCKEKLHSSYINRYKLLSDKCREIHIYGSTDIFAKESLSSLCKPIKYLNKRSIESYRIARCDIQGI